jgi:hypothetical protein
MTKRKNKDKKTNNGIQKTIQTLKTEQPEPILTIVGELMCSGKGGKTSGTHQPVAPINQWHPSTSGIHQPMVPINQWHPSTSGTHKPVVLINSSTSDTHQPVAHINKWHSSTSGTHQPVVLINQ